MERPNTAQLGQGLASDSGVSLWLLLGSLVAMAIGTAAVLSVRRHRKLDVDRERLGRSVDATRVRVGVVRERAARLSGQAEMWRMTSSGQTAVHLMGLIRENTEAGSDTERAAALLSNAMPKGAAEAGALEVAQGSQANLDLAKAVDRQETMLDRLASFGAHLDHLRIAMPAKRQLLEEELVEVEDLAATRAGEGWEVEKIRTELLDRAAQTVTSFDLDGLELDLVSLSDQLETAEANLFAAEHDLRTLPNRAVSLKEWSAELDRAGEMELQRIQKTRIDFASTAAAHASGSWQWAADLPEQAVEELEVADDLRILAVVESIEHQDFELAGRQLEQAGLHTIEADRLLDQVDDLIVDLRLARQQAPAILAQAKEILSDLGRFVQEWHHDLDPELINQPQGLSAALDGLIVELQATRPNYLQVAESGDRINRRIDEVFAAAKDQQARMNALRREANREAARAMRAIERARRSLGWDLFPARDASAIDRLEELLERLPDDVQQRIVTASTIADQALALQERIVAKRRRNSAWVLTNSGGGFGGGNFGGIGGSARTSRTGASRGRASGSRSLGGSTSRGSRSFGGGRGSRSF